MGKSLAYLLGGQGYDQVGNGLVKISK